MTLTIGSCLSPKVRTLASSLIQGLIQGNPSDTLSCFMPKICSAIEQIRSTVSFAASRSDDKEDSELNWYLNTFVELVLARGDTLVIYQKSILTVFHQCIGMMNERSYALMASAARNLLRSLTQIYPSDYRLTLENLDEPFTASLPIRVNSCFSQSIVSGMI
jgi:hypothetical protein